MRVFIFNMNFEKFIETVFQFVVTFVTWFKTLFKTPDYYIQNVKFVYTRNDIRCADDITYDYRESGPKNTMDEMSSNVTDFLFRIKYVYNSKKYIYITRNPNHIFPPIKTGVKFSLPIKEAILLDAEDIPVLNVTDHIKMYEGPNCDFHGEDIRLYDIESRHPKIRLTNILGTVVEYTMETDIINHQTLWLQGKT